MAQGAKCDECPLRDEKYATGKGPDKADIVIVGEAPGAQEVSSGTPFTGASGKLLDRVLQHSDIVRDEIYVTNVCLCRPPSNATPTNEAIKACLPRLLNEVRQREPKKILALGNTAAKTILNTRTGITTLRTEQNPSPYFTGVQIYPTFHPAAALRSPDMLPSIVSDVSKVAKVAKVDWEYTQVDVQDITSTAIHKLWEQLDNCDGLVSLDIEIAVDDMRRLDARRPDFLCIGISHRFAKAVVYTKRVVDDPMFRLALDNAFQREGIRWAMQNGKFDIQFLWGAGIQHARVDEDTMLMHYATDERKGTHDLEQLAVEVLGAPKYKTDAKQYLPRKGASLALLPTDILYQYNAADADVTRRLIEPLWKEVESDGVVRPYRELLIPGSNSLARAEYNGTRVDVARLSSLDSELRSHLGGLEEELSRWVDNPRSPIQVKAALADLGKPVPSTDKENLGKLVKEGGEAGEFAGRLLNYRTDAKLLSTYVVGLGRSVVRSRLHPTFLLHGTETGRLSCRRPNLQNIPSGSTIRDIFTCAEENVLLSADYSQIEFRLAAILSGDPWLLDQFRAGRQFHKEVARAFYGATWTDQQYLRAKAVNFGLLYGRMEYSLAEEWHMPLSEARALKNAFFKQMPLVKEYQKDLERQIREKGYLESYFGRKRRFWLVTRDNWESIKKEGYNFPLQSTASDLTLSSLIQLTPILRGRASPIITVHDSIIFEVKKAYLAEVAQTVKQVMEATPFAAECPTPVDMKVGTRWGSLEAYSV